MNDTKSIGWKSVGSTSWQKVNSSHPLNDGKSVASFCHQVAAWVSDMFCHFHLLKNHQITQQPLKLLIKLSKYF